LRDIAEQRAGFDEARARHIGDDDFARADRFHQAGHAELRGGVEFERIAPVGVDAAQKRVGALEAGDGAHMHLVVAHDEVAAFDQQEAEIAREIGLLVIGLAVGAGREQADARLAAVRRLHQPRAKLAEEAGEAVDVEVAIEIGEDAAEDEAVFQRVAGARRRLRAIAQHPPASVRAAPDVGGVEAQPATAGGPDAMQRANEIGRAEYGGGGQDAVGDESAFAVDVSERAVPQFGALRDAALQIRPFGAVDQQRQATQWPRALARFAIDAIGHAGLADQAIGGCESLPEILLAVAGERDEEFHPVLARDAVRLHEFVGHAVDRVITGDPVLDLARDGRLAAAALGAAQAFLEAVGHGSGSARSNGRCRGKSGAPVRYRKGRI
jgi:hypothetical protein